MANDDFTDLTEEEGAEDQKPEKAKREKKKKEPKQPKDLDEPSPGKYVKPGKKKGRKLKIILIIVLILLIGGFVFEEVYYNILGTRDVLIDAVVRIDPEFRGREAELDEKAFELGRWEVELDAREKAALSRETQNDRRKSDLDSREELLNVREQLAEPVYKRVMTEQEILDMQSLSRAYSMMAPESAAVILMELEHAEDVAAILYYMTERYAAAILAVMDPIYAAIITEILLYQ